MAAAIAAGAIAIAGCGGGGEDGTSSAAATAPTTVAQGQQEPPSSGKFRPDKVPTTSSPATPNSPPAGAEEAQRVLAPFRDCVSRHGVDPAKLGPGGWRQLRTDAAQRQKAIEAGIACIPELPPRLREGAERLKRRYEQQQGLAG